MDNHFTLVKPYHLPPLEDGFRPAVLANHHFLNETGRIGERLIIGLERESGKISRFETRVFPKDHPRAQASLEYVERLVKFLLWARGGYRVMAGGPHWIGDHLQRYYSETGGGQFDYRFMGQQVYHQPFSVQVCNADEVPSASEAGEAIGGHLDGYRIGFDLGASDRKVSAVVDGKVVYSEEVVWEPRKHADPDYHYREIRASVRSAFEKIGHVQAIGGSSAGIIINNRPMVASLFRSVPEDHFEEVRSLFTRLQDEFKVPIVVINDGDVAALAGAMSLEDNSVMGIALGSSQAAGYIDNKGHILGWLNELAFAPIDFNPQGPVDEWSNVSGVGSQYFSQQCVFRLAPKAGISIPSQLNDAEKLVYVQEKLAGGHEGAVKIWQTMGIALGYAIAHYADYYSLKHVLIMGRCTSGDGGHLLIDGAKMVLRDEFPDLVDQIHVQLPDEKSRRVGQAIAAASLPVISSV